MLFRSESDSEVDVHPRHFDDQCPLCARHIAQGLSSDIKELHTRAATEVRFVEMVASCREAALVIILLLGYAQTQPAEDKLAVRAADSIIHDALRPLYQESAARAADGP